MCCSCKRQFKEAVTEFEAALSIDPEDLQAHYNLMLCYQGLGDREQAAREEQLYRRFKADESAQAITGPFRQLNPHDNNERQSVHEHRTPTPAKAGIVTTRRSGPRTRNSGRATGRRHRRWPVRDRAAGV